MFVFHGIIQQLLLTRSKWPMYNRQGRKQASEKSSGMTKCRAESCQLYYQWRWRPLFFAVLIDSGPSRNFFGDESFPLRVVHCMANQSPYHHGTIPRSPWSLRPFASLSRTKHQATARSESLNLIIFFCGAQAWPDFMRAAQHEQLVQHPDGTRNVYMAHLIST